MAFSCIWMEKILFKYNFLKFVKKYHKTLWYSPPYNDIFMEDGLKKKFHMDVRFLKNDEGLDFNMIGQDGFSIQISW